MVCERGEQVHRALSAWDFGELLGLLRRRSGLSQTAVRSLTGLTQSFISDLERGRKHLALPHATSWSAANPS
ncbi:helix-turn-helix domain-containing protein [Streptomyces sp. NPDC094448]|uniref:helix-turn-helix domain-containing protein n=1 Tax=Streptomyces sp. NPDC094448 TaxID=3366063 RepID=UPI00382D7BD8